MYGPPDHMALRFADGSAVALGGHWRYQFVPESMGFPPRAPWESVGGLTEHLQRHDCAARMPTACAACSGIRANPMPEKPAQYQALLAALMGDWRRQFGADLPFLIVELPNFGAPDGRPARPTGRTCAKPSAAPSQKMRTRRWP